jgi:DNA-binding transcriptional ArsR family regulator
VGNPTGDLPDAPARSGGEAPAPAHPGAVLAALADEVRLRVLAAVVLGSATVEEVASVVGVDLRRVRRAVERLISAGLLARNDAGDLMVTLARLHQSARLASRLRPLNPPPDVGAGPEQAAVLRSFLVDGRLVSIPAARGKRRMVLDYLAQTFEPGRVYPERQVNFMLGQFHDDFAALRRFLVDEEFLERRGGFYWRAGGTFEVG